MQELDLFRWREALTSRHGPASSTQRHVLLTLSLHMNRTGGSCFPSTKTLARETGLSERTVVTHLGEAAEAGWIGRSNHGITGQGWRRYEYQAQVPVAVRALLVRERAERGSEPRTKGTEPYAEGAENDGRNVLKQVQSSTSVSSTSNCS